MAQTNEDFLSDSDILDIVLEKEQQMVEAIEDVSNGLINPLIIKGPPGTGKTETIAQLTKKAKVKSYDLISSTFEEPPKGAPTYPHDLVSLKEVDGALVRSGDYSTWALFADLYANRQGGILCLDDNDSILTDEAAVAILQKATEQKSIREVTYTKAAKIHDLALRAVPPVFDTACPVIILTNMDIKGTIAYQRQREKAKGTMPAKYIKRWEALLSRGSYIDLGMNTPRSIRVFCEYKIKQANILTKSGFLNDKFGKSLTKQEMEEVLKWVRFHQGELAQPLDIRTYNKVAVMMLNRKSGWEKSAKISLLKGA
jgi:hypothetical protein